jgi:apolipoprotein N-acyltransferase
MAGLAPPYKRVFGKKLVSVNNNTQKNLWTCLAFAASAVMLTVIQPPFGIWQLAWVALVPFIIVCSPQANLKWLIPVSYAISLCYWLGNLYWIGPVTWAGWLTFCFYTALLWPMLAICVRFCRRKNIPLFWAVPILVVGAERLQGLFLGGFYWRHLSHSQYENTTLIQIADIFGAAGVSFLVAMVNGLIAELIIAARGKKILKIGYLFKTAVVCIAIAGTIFYGRWRIGQTEQFVEEGPLVAAVQSNVPQSVKRSHAATEEIFNDMVNSSQASAKAGAELIVWPETMVQAVLDERILCILDSSSIHKMLDKQLREHAKATGAYILAGATGGSPEIKDNFDIVFADKYNSAFLYQPDGNQAKEHYNKIHLVPFGEVVPFKDVFPLLHKLLMKFTPYDYDYTLNYGTEYTVFEMRSRSKKTCRFGAMICYEGTIPSIARKFALDDKPLRGRGNKKVDWLVNISNDGWFVAFEDGKVSASTELSQHTAICAFRAVENRLAILRSVNTGISCLIDTAGRIKSGFSAGNLPINAMERTGMAGWFADKVPIDKRVTVFSRCGQWLDLSCAVCFILLLIGLFWERIRKSKIKNQI